ncbi:MAG: hypothetical protein M3347_00845 [Armatimonadota bacterium]|nr:hypothetical protein [Armatimonadota bacterium]
MWPFSKSNQEQQVRRELIEFLGEAMPEMRVMDENEEFLTLHSEQIGEAKMFLHRLYGAVAGLKPSTPQARRTIFEQFVAPLRESIEMSSQPFTLETVGHRILPRLVPPAFFEQFSGEMQLPHRPWGWTGLSIAYVLDSEGSVAYLTRTHTEDLGIDDAVLHELALANLRKIFPPETIRQLLSEQGSVQVVKAGDGHDAARVLLVREGLEEHAEIAAIIPDRDTLILAPVPADGDWSGLRKLAAMAPEPRLLDRPLKITSNGVELM